MGRFKVVKGSHYDKAGVRYRQGDIIESDEQLDEIHANKFEEVFEKKAKNAKPVAAALPPTKKKLAPQLAATAGSGEVDEDGETDLDEDVEEVDSEEAAVEEVLTAEEELPEGLDGEAEISDEEVVEPPKPAKPAKVKAAKKKK